MKRWLKRFVASGLQIYLDEVVAAGFPWKTTACVRGSVDLRDDAGAIVYDNRYVIWGHLAWGRMREYEVYEDTRSPRSSMPGCLSTDQSWLPAGEVGIVRDAIRRRCGA